MIKEKADRSWKGIQEIGQLHPNIRSAEDYNSQMYKNMAKVNLSLQSEVKPYLTSNDIKNIHESMFDGITTFGGQNTAQIRIFGGQTGADPKYIDNELKLLDKQMEVLWNKAETPSDKIDVLAFQHTRLVNIHGFEDGNGRVSRMTTSYAMDKLSIGQAFHIDRDSYIEDINQAHEGNIGMLSASMAESWNIDYTGTSLKISEFRIKPFRSEENDISKALEKSVSREPDQGMTESNFLTQFDVNLMIERVGGKKASNFDQEKNKLSEAIKKPKSINKTVDLIKEFKESKAIKSGLFKKADDGAYKSTVKESLAIVARSLQDSKQAEFYALVDQKLSGHNVDLDAFVKKSIITYQNPKKEIKTFSFKKSQNQQQTKSIKTGINNSSSNRKTNDKFVFQTLRVPQKATSKSMKI